MFKNLFSKKPKKETKKPKGEDISQIARDYNIRVSSPHGYFPEDVDNVLEDLTNKLNTSNKTESMLRSQVAQLEKDNEMLKGQISKLQLDIQTIGLPETSYLEDLAAFDKLENIKGNVRKDNIDIDLETLVHDELDIIETDGEINSAPETDTVIVKGIEIV